MEAFLNLDLLSNPWLAILFLGPVFYFLEKKFPYNKKNQNRKLADTIEDLSWQLGDNLYSFLWFPFYQILTVTILKFYMDHIHYPLAGTLRNRFDYDLGQFEFIKIHMSNVYVQFIVLLLLTDFLRFVYHYLAHVYGRIWKFHALHHSPTVVDWLTTSRVHFLESLLGFFYMTPVLFFFDIKPEVMAWIAVLELHMNLFVHSNINIELGFLKYVINNPKAHHWHHSSKNELEHGQNFSSIFIFWDFLFKTYYMPAQEEAPEQYGLANADVFPQNIFKRIFYPLT